ncbi:ABC transporter permease [Reichenbachiella sp.]|uniref:ABC transporter permease n=1 Tax=Reichenbachiella sp. TaxID=2184521 RepID=UPI003B5CE8E8
MFKNYYLTATRNLLKYKSYFFTNVLGLALGIASFSFIAIYVWNEISYDQFHADHERIYRISSKAVIRGKPNHDATTGAPLAKTMLSYYPEVQKATGVLDAGSVLIRKDNKKFIEDRMLFADSSFLSVFDFKLLKGNPRTALAAPRSVVLSERYARKYFGDEEALGQFLSVEEDSVSYIVTGVVENILPNSHIQFDIMGSMISRPEGTTTHWIGTDVHNYIQLDKHSNPSELAIKSKEIFYDFIAPEIEYYTGIEIEDWEKAGNTVGFQLTPIQDIHLRSTASNELEPTGNSTYVYIYGIIGIVTLFIAIFNFVNLATAHSLCRAKEVGVRKVIGSTKQMLVIQFMVESLIISYVASLLAVGFIVALMPSFTSLIGKDLSIGLFNNSMHWMFIVVLASFVGIVAGVYPSLVLSNFRPVQVLKGDKWSGAKSGWLRNLLVTLQFTASIVIIVWTLVVYNQISYMLAKNLGFDKEQMLVIKRPDWLGGHMEAFKNDLLGHPQINGVANSKTIPGKEYKIRSYRKQNEAETFLFLNNQVTHEYKDLIGLELLAGRFFASDMASDSSAVVINESAARAFGFDDPIGQPLTSAFSNGPLHIIGVIKDYNIESLHKPVEPVSLEYDPGNQEGYISIKFNNTTNILETLTAIEESWDQHSGGEPFQYFFFDEEYQRLYESEVATGKILFVFASLSIFIASLGLIGLITYSATRRRKEVGIRKVLGAGIRAVFHLLSAEVSKLIGLAILISWPISYWASNYWLQNFADRQELNIWVFIDSMLVVILVVGVIVGLQTLRSSNQNPIDSLRQE